MLKVITASTREELERKTRGRILGKYILNVGRDINPSPAAAPNNLYKHPVDGLTLNWTGAAPNTVTFVGDLDFREIVAAINAVEDVAHLEKVDANGGVVLSLYGEVDAVQLSPGTANAYLGLPAGTTAQGGMDAATIISITLDPSNRCWACFYNE